MAFENRTAFHFKCNNCNEEVHQGTEPKLIQTVVDGAPAEYFACSKCAKYIKEYHEEYEKEVARKELEALGVPIPPHLRPKAAGMTEEEKRQEAYMQLTGKKPTPEPQPQNYHEVTREQPSETSLILTALQGLTSAVKDIGNRVTKLEKPNAKKEKPATTGRRTRK